MTFLQFKNLLIVTGLRQCLAEHLNIIECIADIRTIAESLYKCISGTRISLLCLYQTSYKVDERAYNKANFVKPLAQRTVL